MSTILITGTLGDVENKLKAIKSVVEDKKLNGYPLWSKYEQWQYSSAGDSRVCPICQGYHGRIFNGDQVKTEFPMVEYQGNYMALPRTHDNPGFPVWIQRRDGAPNGCGCILRLLNPAEAFEAQLHEDKLREI